MPINSGSVASGMRVEPYRTIMSYAPAVYWRFDEASGTIINYGSTASRNGTMSGTPVYGAAKIPTRSPKLSMTFDGVNDYMSVTDGVITGTSPIYSAGIWVKTSATIGTLLQQMDATNSAAGFSIYLTTGPSIGIVGRTTAGVIEFSTTYGLEEIDDGIPLFIGLSVTSTYARVFINGVYVTQAIRTGGVYSSTSDIRVGANYDGSEFFTGTISDAFIISGSALNQDDWYKIYRNGMINATSPVNDNWNDATLLTGSSGSVLATLTGASLEPQEPRGNSLSIYYPEISDILASPNGVWYKMTPVSNTTLIFDTVSTTCLISLYKQTGSSIATLELIDDKPDPFAPALRGSTLYAGTTYYIKVPAYQLATGTMTLTWSSITPPTNDNFASAQTVSVISAGNVSGTTVDATTETLIEKNNSGPRPVWYKFQADTTGVITIDTEISSTIDSVLVVWQAASNATIANIDFQNAYAYDDDSGVNATSKITAMAVTNGLWYYIQVTDYDGGTAFTLSWSDIT